MSVRKVNMCDVDDCRQIANNQLKDFLYTQWTDNGTNLILLKDVDLCDTHDYQYRTRVPVVHIGGDNAHRGQEEDIR